MLTFFFVSRAEPRIVGRYAIYGEIASGGMASVHFARLVGPSGFARTVAVKRAHPHLAREPDFALMFLDEARVASRIRHPNVVSTIDVLSTPDDLVLVMDYVHGESLWKLVRALKDRNERVPVEIAASILVDTLHGLHAAHEATDERGAPLGIVHRDVSPQNILVGADGVTRLVDFGIAKAAGRLHSTRDSSVKGKYGYMAPEQARGEAVSRLTDTYAAAIVFWELLTGERLFAGKTEAETIHRCLVGRVQPPSLFAPDLPAKMDEILRKALSREPSKRYQTARELALDIEACVQAVRPSEVGAWVEEIAGDALAARAEVLAEIERGETHAPTRSRKTALVATLILAAIGAGAATFVATRRAPVVAPSAPSTGTLVASAPEPAASAPPVAIPPPSAPVPEVTAKPSASAPPPATHPLPRTVSPPRSNRPKRGACNPPYSIDSEGRQIFKPECM
jgi:eukaryotic-like serine/threonine-protein kinase